MCIYIYIYFKSEVREARGQSVTDHLHNKIAWKKVRGKFPPPLLFVARDQVGPNLQPVDSISTDPAEVDNTVTRIWSKIYDICLVSLVSFFVMCFAQLHFILNPSPGPTFKFLMHASMGLKRLEAWTVGPLTTGRFYT